VTRKITRGLANISQGIDKCLHLGNMDALRDWGHAKDYVRMQWMMLQQDAPDDFCIATGKQYSVRDFVNLSLKELNIKYYWKGKGINEKCFDDKGNCIIECDKEYFRPLEVDTLLGDSSKARKELNWKPKYNINSLIKEMVIAELKNLGFNDIVIDFLFKEFWNKENNYIVGKSIIEILDYSKAIGYSYQHPTETISEELIEQCYKIGYRLRDETGIAEIDAIKPIEDTRDYKLLSESIKNHILKDQPEAGLDRLHTYLVGYIRSLCEKHEIEYEKKESLNAIFGKYVKNLVKLEKIESEMTVKILKFSISILDSFNYIRNNKSLAHDNEKIAEYSESILIFNNINSLVKFIQVIEERFDNERKMNEPIIEEEDNLPF
jgi:hypothetical protein